VANIGGLKDAVQIAEFGGEGVGLLRSEFLFMDRNSAPTEDEQFDAYRRLHRRSARTNRSSSRTSMWVVTSRSPICRSRKRTIPFSANAGCASRSIRPEILRAQLRAILRSSAFGKVSVMFPMISSLDELREVKAILAEECRNLGVAPIPTGIMVEVPATA
jgi:phosphocarrier protein FPr